MWWREVSFDETRYHKRVKKWGSCTYREGFGVLGLRGVNGLAAGFSVKVFFGGALTAGATPPSVAAPVASTVELGFTTELTTAGLTLTLLAAVFIAEDATGGEVVLGCGFCCCWGGG